jgi:cytochrome c-type biogenesis protein CcmE
MQKKYLKFGSLITVILGTLGWLAYQGISDTSTYFKTVSEVKAMGDSAHSKRLKLQGWVVGDIERNGKAVSFTMRYEKDLIKVVYEGTDPLPDTLRAEADAVADGRLAANGVFHASKVQAKCASKYEAKPGEYKLAAPASRT